MRHNQNRRSRGRNNRKGPNPLTRSFESNGPDVKVRGTAAHIAEKYTSLARDAQAAGDIVGVESYLQHAEHYNRIVMAAQAQFQQSQPQYRDGPDEGYDDRQMNGRERFDYNGDGRSGEDEGDERVEASEEEGDDRGYQPRQHRSDDQYRQQQRGPRQDRYQYRDRQDRDRNGERPDRSDRQEQYEDREPRREPVAAQAPPAEAQAQPEAVEIEAGAPPPPRRRRGRPRNDNGGPGPDSDEARNQEATPDGAAALAAFRGDS
jgi:hypothetical protein